MYGDNMLHSLLWLRYLSEKKIVSNDDGSFELNVSDPAENSTNSKQTKDISQPVQNGIDSGKKLAL